MTAPIRWLLVGLLAVVVAAPPTVLRIWPASGSGLSAARVADQARAAEHLGWTGEVHTVGSLKLPDTGSFGNLAKLLGENSDLRVWWHDDENWRVDRTRSSGESDLMRNDDRLLRWTYESRRAVITGYSPVRLPDESDLLPPTLAARVLSGAKDSELTRLTSKRLAGRSAAGLRLVPDDARSTVSHVDMWMDQATGLPLEVVVYAQGSRVPVLTTQVSSVHVRRPALATTRFDPPPGIRVVHSYAIDDAAGANAFAPFLLPRSVAGLSRRGDPATFGAVGVYGRSVTDILVIPLRRHIAGELFDQLHKSKASVLDEQGLSLRLGPISVLLTRHDGGTFLLTGTVTPDALRAAVPDLRNGVTVGRR